LIIRTTILSITLALSVAACTKGSGSAVEESMPAGDSPAGQAVTDLSERLDIPAENIEVLLEENVTWRDGSLGCPKPDMMYTQALVEGVQIILRVDGKDYAYHSGSGRPPFYCENPVSPARGSAAE